MPATPLSLSLYHCHFSSILLITIDYFRFRCFRFIFLIELAILSLLLLITPLPLISPAPRRFRHASDYATLAEDMPLRHFRHYGLLYY